MKNRKLKREEGAKQEQLTEEQKKEIKIQSILKRTPA